MCQCHLTWFHYTMELCAACPEVWPEVVAVTVEDFVHDAVCQGHCCYVTMVQADFTTGHKVLQQITRHLDMKEEDVISVLIGLYYTINNSFSKCDLIFKQDKIALYFQTFYSHTHKIYSHSFILQSLLASWFVVDLISNKNINVIYLVHIQIYLVHIQIYLVHILGVVHSDEGA